MKPDRSDQVVARVVAWHNRHPLAQRITAAQVHSVGVVTLPYAVRGASREPGPPAAEPIAGPEQGPVLVPAEADRLAFDGLDRAAPPVDAAPAAAEPAAAGAGADPGGSEMAAEPPVPASSAPADTGVAEVAAVAPAEAPQAADAPGGAPARPAAPRVHLPPRPRAWDPRNWWAAWRGREAFRALFSEDFIAPLRPRRVGRWVAQHGVSVRPLEADAPERVVELDPRRRTPDAAAPELELHVLTAAIGVGDRRLRVLLAPDERGPILGPRQWSRPRLAATAGVLALLTGLALLQVGPRSHGGEHTLAAAAAASATAAASSASVAAAASAVVLASRAAPSPASAGLAQSAVASAPASLAQAASSPAYAASVASAASSPGLSKLAQAHSAAASSTASGPTALAAAPAASAASAAPRLAAAPTEPRSTHPRRGRIDLQPLVPKLGDAERHELRTAGRGLRGEPAVLPDAKAWALATAPSADRRQSERAAAQLHALALLQPIPMRAELVRTGNRWRAVCWPFPTEGDAEKVRLALADKGLQTEVVEF